LALSNPVHSQSVPTTLSAYGFMSNLKSVCVSSSQIQSTTMRINEDSIFELHRLLELRPKCNMA
jgi:hypothetical protein